MVATYGIHWFRQDLRLQENPSLLSLSKKVDQIIPIYILDLNQRIGSTSKWWLEKSLISLYDSIQKHNGKLNIFAGDPEKIISSILKNSNVKYVSWNRLYDPYSIKRDTKIKSIVTSSKIECDSHNGYLLNEPWNIKNKSGTFFKVFTPYWRHCDELLKLKDIKFKNTKISYANSKFKNEITIQDLNLTNKKEQWIKKIEKYWIPGESNAKLQLKKYISQKANNYSVGRDRPDKDLTSKLSPYLHFGEISAVEVYDLSLIHI